MGYNRKQFEKRERYLKAGKKPPRSVYQLRPLTLDEMPGDVAREVLERTEKRQKDARRAG